MEYKVATVLSSLNVKEKLMFILRVRSDIVTSCEQSSLSGDNESLWTLVIHAAAMFTLDAKISGFPSKEFRLCFKNNLKSEKSFSNAQSKCWTTFRVSLSILSMFQMCYRKFVWTSELFSTSKGNYYNLVEVFK